MLATLLVAASMAAPPAPPPPDPYPGSTSPISWVAYDYHLPVVNADTGDVMASMYFHCHVPVRWHGRFNSRGHAVCKLARKP
jgi:hypothetical protein